MKRRNTFVSAVLAVALLLPLLSFEVLANSPPDAELAGAVELPASVGVLMLTLFSIPGLIVTVLSEWVTAGFFGIVRREGRVVLRVNLISQILMRIVFVLICGAWKQSYWLSILFLEFAVYTLEYLVYRRLIKCISVKKLLAYTITANTVSLVLGLLMNDWLFV